MRRTFTPTTCNQRRGFVYTVGLSFLCLALFAGYAQAQAPPADPEPKGNTQNTGEVKNTGKAEGAAEAEPKGQANPKDTAKAQVTHKGKHKTSKQASTKGRKRIQFEMDPNAKWACDQQTVTLEPVWREDKKLNFAFHIRNEGTADLKIKARGG